MIRSIPAVLLLPLSLAAQNSTSGQHLFEANCSVCHGADGAGGELGPSIVNRVSTKTDSELAAIVTNGIPARGMPGLKLKPVEIADLTVFMRSLRARLRAAQTQVPKTVTLAGGKALTGLVMNQSFEDLQLRSPDQRVHLLRPETKGTFREVTSQTDWTSYNGNPNGNRHTPLTEIDKFNIGRLVAKWVFPMEGVNNRQQTTPVVVEGIMYVPSANECWALDAGSGREIWHYQRPRTRNLIGNAAAGINRGVAWSGNRIFMVTDHAHIIALNRFTGALEWETTMADHKVNYNATSAPLIAGKWVVTGTAGGEQGVRGFIAAYDIETGKEGWRFWTVPAPGEPGSETWKGKAILHPSSAAWFTGSYDADLGMLYWQVGNPGPDYDDAERGGDNLYSCSVVALDVHTGKLRWHYQFTPHDVFDWDATEPVLLVDAHWKGQPRKLLLQGNRNGFFYVLDRVNGKLLLAEPFVKKMTWASRIGEDGRPVLQPLPNTGGGTQVCPSQDGATNWYSSSYNPALGLFFMQTLEKCGVYYKRPQEWTAGRNYLGGSQRSVIGETAQKFLRALDIQTGKVVWELAQNGRGDSWGGTLSTASGMVFFCDDSGLFMAVDSQSGKPLWRFQTNQVFRASPMTYAFDGHQHIAVVAGGNVLAFSLLHESTK